MGANLLEISVDELFETHSIMEIGQIQLKIQEEVGKKREELRTMVGERYRDLLKAADAIEKMKETSSSVATEIFEITSHCKNLHEKQLLGFKIDSYQTQQLNKRLNQYFSLVFQIKLLTSLPEIIWSHIDRKNYFLATQLFIFSKHISSGLQLNVDNDFIKYFVVAKKQWAILEPFYSTLKQVSTAALEKEYISTELACDCLLSIFLLEKNSLEGILNTFLHLRTKAYLITLCGGDKIVKKRVRNRILTSLQVLNSTVHLIEACFVGNNFIVESNFNTTENTKGLIFQELEKLNQSSSLPSIALMNLDDIDFANVLPDIISKFRPSLPTPILSVETIRQKVENWYLSISNVANNQLKNLFDLVSSMKTLKEIQKQALEIGNFPNWYLPTNNKFGEVVLSTVSTFYKNLYKPLLKDRACEIIRQCWSNCIKSTSSEIYKLLKLNKECRNDEIFLYTDHLEDLPVNLQVVLNQNKKQNILLMKNKGYNKDIIQICSFFDDQLEVILKDLEYFVSENTDDFEELKTFVDFVRDVSKEYIYEFIKTIESNGIEQILTNFILVARILSAIIELCPNLRFCLTYSNSDSNWKKSNDKNILEIWYEVCKLFEEKSFFFWKLFCDSFLKQFSSEKWIINTFEYHVILYDFLNWDSISIEERDEHNNPLQSTIKVPSQIRVSLQLYFFELISALNKYVPQTLPGKVLYYFNNILLDNLLKHYSNSLEKRSLLNQNIALQIYFDLKLLQLLFITRDDKKKHEIQKLTNILKNYVDPFDFELFHKYLNNNVKKCALQMQHQLSIILPHPELLETATGDSKQSVITHERDPNVLSISCNGSSSTWFSLLPILISGKPIPVVSLETEKISSVMKLSKTSESTSSQQNLPQTAQVYARNVKSGAASFFGSMSQDWFR